MIGVVDYGMGNLGSIVNMLQKIDAQHVVTDDGRVLDEVDRIILPGVGAFGRGMKALDDRGLRSVLDTRVFRDEIPVLGVCLGAQLLARRSEEGTGDGLGWIEADVVRLAPGSALKVPHMGWSDVEILRPSRLFDAEVEARFYFVHSYHIVCDDEDDIVAVADYGGAIVAGIEHANVFGVQFHPEKSHTFGLELLSRFAGLDPGGS